MTAQHLIFRDFLERNRERFPMTLEALMALEASEIHEAARLTPEQARYAYDVAIEPLVSRGELRDIEPEFPGNLPDLLRMVAEKYDPDKPPTPRHIALRERLLNHKFDDDEIEPEGAP